MCVRPIHFLRIHGLHLLGNLNQFRQEFIVNNSHDDKPLIGITRLARVVHASFPRQSRRSLHVSRVEHDIRIRTSQL